MAIDNTNLVMFRDNAIANKLKKYPSISAAAKNYLRLYFYLSKEIEDSLKFNVDELRQITEVIQHIQVTETNFLPVIVREKIKNSELDKVLINKVLALSDFEIVVLSEMAK